MLNYEVDEQILYPYLPPGTVLDTWQGKALVSMVGFLFEDTRVLGIKWPRHVDFEEVNLRFYVRYFDGQRWKRGAVFISEIVPKPVISIIANSLYKEHYAAMPMKHAIVPKDDAHTGYLYQWKFDGKWNKLGATVENQSQPMLPGSAEEFIFEHYWGYNKLNDAATLEYAVEHVSWEVRKVRDFVFEADVAGLYGEQFVPFLNAQPVSAFFANGSAVAVRVAGRIKAAPIPQK